MSSRKAKSQIRTCTETVRMQSYGFEKQRLTAPAQTLALALQQLAEAQPRSHHHHHLYKQRDQTTSGYEPFFCVWRKPRPNQSSSPTSRKKSKKPKSQKHKNRALLGGTTERNLPSRPRHRNATGNKARERFLAKSKKNWPRVLDRLHVLSHAYVSESADIMLTQFLFEQRDPQRKERRVFFGKSRGAQVLRVCWRSIPQKRCAHLKGRHGSL
jgi:hypothetical protein